MPIYTRTGDQGQTSLFTGQRIPKSSPIIEFVGELDELNALLGICVLELEKEEEVDFTLECEVLEEIQRDLFVVGSIAVGAGLKFDSQSEVANIESTIDEYEKILPKLKNFILPGGSSSAVNLHYCRTFVRKIERRAVMINSKSLNLFLPYLNRLSDLLFMMARYVNYKLKIEDTVWRESK